MSALAALLNEQAEQEYWQTYVADATCRLVHLWSKNCRVPYYSTLTGRRQEQKDSRTGQEIVDDIIKRLRHHQAAKKGGSAAVRGETQ